MCGVPDVFNNIPYDTHEHDAPDGNAAYPDDCSDIFVHFANYNK